MEGHQDWVRSLAFAKNGKDLVLASGAQDGNIRLWRFSDTLLESFLSVDLELKEGISTASLGTRGSLVCVSKGDHVFRFSIIFDAMLLGHEDWVYSVSWHPEILNDNNQLSQPMCLLSCSMDKTMMIWRPERESSLWLNDVRVGEVGGHTLGLFGAQFGPNGKSMLAHGYHGALHLWRNESENCDDGQWFPCPTVSGHFRGVQDLTWDAFGDYVISCSLDQTTRVFSNLSATDEWFEIARPQTHGYDMNAICVLPNIPHRFASAAAEKVIRIFDATDPFIQSLETLSNVLPIINDPIILRAEKAAIPELGLSNKGTLFGDVSLPERHGFEILIADEDGNDSGYNVANNSAPISFKLTAPPLEEFLIAHSVWPEVEKLYGPPYDVISVAASNSGSYLAASCFAKKPEHAQIILWNANNWKESQKLSGHSLSVAQIKFSHSDEYILTVSRDRSFCLYKKEVDKYETLVVSGSVHARIIWSADWTFDDEYFATGSRDKIVKIWKAPKNGDPTSVRLDSSLPAFSFGVTAVAFSPFLGKPTGELIYLLAIGLEDGTIQIWKGSTVEVSSICWSLFGQVANGMQHDSTVRKLAWSSKKGKLRLASCSHDHSVRIYNVTF